MIFSMTGEEKGDLLIQVTAWAGLSVYIYLYGLTDSMFQTQLNGTHRISNSRDKDIFLTLIG